ncbi:hypothetical protein LCGC14_0371040 [marine sediment metagenome]|uniref:Uncharacterized protein n=1 Tax=marine sediment metagenome TaxID=412755 RepID=A0A0F9WDW1_9ZZZZ|nr:hypothetical protein [Maribacter sp.]HDZ04861.1 hypothetical protein [Maribacter sp.]
MIIINGGNPLKDCPTDWHQAEKWCDDANNKRADYPQWSFDSGFKLDYDGDLISLNCRFYPPKTHYGETWDGTATVSIFGNKVEEKKFDCETLEQLKAEVESYIEKLKQRVRLLT